MKRIPVTRAVWLSAVAALALGAAGAAKAEEETLTFVWHAGTCADAIVKIAEQAPDLILMDCHMPGMSGIEATRLIRAAGYDRPIVAVSADVTTDNATAVVAAGMQGILGKPFRQADLFQAVEAALIQVPDAAE